jgi:hypothetical protein
MPDLPQIVAVDDGFVGVLSRIDPALLPASYVSFARNRRFEDQVIKNRWGVVQPKWGGKWQRGERVATVTAGSAIVSPVSGPQIPAGSQVACDIGLNQSIFSTGTRCLIDDGTNTVLSTAALTFSPSSALKTLSFYQDTLSFDEILGVLPYRDPDTGANALLVASNEVRTSDDGQGKVWCLRPNQSPVEVPMNGHDIYAPVRLIQAANGVVMLRPGNARYYFGFTTGLYDSLLLESNDVPNNNEILCEDSAFLSTEFSTQIVLNVVPDLETGDEVIVGQVGSTQPLWFGSPSTGQGFRLYVNVVNQTVSLHLTIADARAATNPLPLSLENNGRYYIELASNTTGYDIAQDVVTDLNDGLPIIMQGTSSNPSALDAGFNRIPSTLSIISSDTTDDTITVYNHNFVPGEQVTLSNVVDPGATITDKVYYVYPVDNNTLKLFSGATEETDSLNDAGRAILQLTTTGVSPNITISAVRILAQGSGYLTAPTITVSGTAGTPANLTATITNGKVSAVTIVAGGAYSTTPTASVAMPSTLQDIASASITGSIKRSSASGASVPPGREGLYFQNRLLLLYGNDYLAVSDVLDPLHYSPVVNEFKLNTGSNDRVVALYPFNATTLLIFKERSVLALENVYGDLSTTRLTEITREFGCVSQASIAGTGSDVIFLSQRGVISLKQTEFGISQSVIVPLSDQIQDIVDSIDQAYWDTSCGVYYANRYLLSAPVEGGDGNNRMTLVYNFLNKAWEGYWDGDLLVPVYWARVIVSGFDTLCWADASGYIHQFDPLGLQDVAKDGGIDEITTEVRFRGYTGEANVDHKQWTDMQMEFSNWNPMYSLTAVFDGVNESYVVATNQTKSRTAYYTYGSGTYNTGNSGDDFLLPYREDYSTQTNLRCGENGWRAGLHQFFTHKARLRKHSASVQPILTTTQGSLDVYSSKVVGVPFRLYGKNDV